MAGAWDRKLDVRAFLDPSRRTVSNAAGGDIADDDGARADHAILTDPDSWDDGGAGADHGPRSNGNIARKMHSGTEVGMSADHAIVIHGAARVENNIILDTGGGVNDHSRHYDHTAANGDIGAKAGERMDESQGSAEGGEIQEYPAADIIAADRDKERERAELAEINGRSLFHAEAGDWSCRRSVRDQAGEVHPARFGEIQHHPSMAAGTIADTFPSFSHFNEC